MALVEFRCQQCQTAQLVFDTEPQRLLDCPHCQQTKTLLKKIPPRPIVIHMTETWTSEPQFDSIYTIYELDRQLNIEAREAKEMEMVNKARKIS